MARPLRVEFPGGVYHLTSRGNARAPVFADDGDRRDFLEQLAECAERFRWLCHAYCLMENHYHLLVETKEANLSRGMRRLNGIYTQGFNRRHDRVGHLFQGRYKAILLEKETHLLELCRYIVLNPVRAGMVKNLEDWPWSSYGATAGLAPAPDFLFTSWVLSRFGKTPGAAHDGYRRFVRQGRSTGAPWGGVRGQLVLGGESFAEKVARVTEPVRGHGEYRKSQRHLIRRPLEEILPAAVRKRSFTADKALYEAHVAHAYTLKEIAEHTRMHYTTVSKRIKKWEGEEKER